jgi:lysozyme family protein
MREFPRPMAVEIFRKRYWEEPGLAKVAELAPDLAAELFDTGINMGTSIPGKFLQRALNVLNRQGRDYPDIGTDGRIGTMTIAALRGFLKVRGAAGEKVLIKACEALQGARYIEIAEHNGSQEDFEFGWLANRIGENLGGSL